ncbi:SLATT domain-containing protein [Kribbella sp. NPDC055110]
MSDRAAQFHAMYRELRIADQRDFYLSRRVEYESAHEQVVTVRNVLLVLSATAGTLGQIPSGTARAVAGLLAAMLATLAGAVTAFEAIIGFPQLSKLYHDAEYNLKEAEIDWDAAAGGSDHDLAAEVDRVEGIFHTENGQWGQLVVENAKEVPKLSAPPDQPSA